MVAKKKADKKVPAKRAAGKVPADVYGDDAGAGFEKATKEFYTIPFLGVLQKGSPQADADDDRYIKGAKPGMLFNTVTSQLFDGKEGVAFIPCEPQHKFVEWVPRDDGGGFVGLHEPTSDVVKKAKDASEDFGHYKIKDNDLVETFYMYGLLLKSDGGREQCVMAFKSTQIKFFRNWMSIAANQMVGNVVPPLFAHRYRIKTFLDENPKGKFHSTRITLDAPEAAECRLLPTDDLYQAAKAYRGMVQQGAARADYASDQQPGAGASDGDEF